MFSLPRGTKMFQFPRFASPEGDAAPSARRVVPFGDPRVNGHLRLDGAYRSLSRPSSPPGAQASTMCPSYTSCHSSHPVRPFRIISHIRLSGEGGSIYIRLFDFCSTLNFSACISMSMISSFSAPCGVVENNGFEPLTPCLQSRCSSQLS